MKKSFGSVFELTNGDDFLMAIDNPEDKVGKASNMTEVLASALISPHFERFLVWKKDKIKLGLELKCEVFSSPLNITCSSGDYSSNCGSVYLKAGGI